MHPHRNYSVHNRCTSEHDRHDDLRRTLGAEGEQDAKGADGSERTREKRDPDTAARETEVGTVELEQRKWRENGEDEVSDTDEKERLVPAKDRIVHRHLSAMKKHPVETPGANGQENVE